MSKGPYVVFPLSQEYVPVSVGDESGEIEQLRQELLTEQSNRENADAALAQSIEAEEAARSEADAALAQSIEATKSPILVVTFQGNESGTLPAFGSDPAKLEFSVSEPYAENYKIIGILSQEFRSPTSERIPAVETFSFTMSGQKAMKIGLTAASSSAAEYASYTIRALLVKDELAV